MFINLPSCCRIGIHITLFSLFGPLLRQLVYNAASLLSPRFLHPLQILDHLSPQRRVLDVPSKHLQHMTGLEHGTVRVPVTDAKAHHLTNAIDRVGISSSAKQLRADGRLCEVRSAGGEGDAAKVVQ